MRLRVQFLQVRASTALASDVRASWGATDGFVATEGLAELLHTDEVAHVGGLRRIITTADYADF